MSESVMVEKPITEQSESETKTEGQSTTSRQTKSSQRDSEDTNLKAKLTLLQEMLFTFQESGGKVAVANLDPEDAEEIGGQNVAAIFISGVKADDRGNLVLCT